MSSVAGVSDKVDPAESARQLRALLDSALELTPAERARLEGAVVALELLAKSHPQGFNTNGHLG